MEAQNERLGPFLSAVVTMACEWFRMLDAGSEDFDAQVELGVELCAALPANAKAALARTLAADWGEHPPAWVEAALQGPKSRPDSGLDMDVWGDFLDGLPDD